MLKVMVKVMVNLVGEVLRRGQSKVNKYSVTVTVTVIVIVTMIVTVTASRIPHRTERQQYLKL